MYVLKPIRIGSSVGINPPREKGAKLGIVKGGTSYGADQLKGVRPNVVEPDFATQMDVACRVMKERGAVLRELAE
jgi:hypothetical protein